MSEPKTSGDRCRIYLENLAEQFSVGAYEKEILFAREKFFEKIGRSFDDDKNFYESVSQSFLEWFVFHFKLSKQQKPPIITALSALDMEEDHAKLLFELSFHFWSLYRVEEVGKEVVVLFDLLRNKKRTLLISESARVLKTWKIEEKQIIQTRLFPIPDQKNSYYSTHIWLHPYTEAPTLEELCQQRQKQWGNHAKFLHECLICLFRSFQYQDQLAALRQRNWIYQELKKDHAAA